MSDSAKLLSVNELNSRLSIIPKTLLTFPEVYTLLLPLEGSVSGPRIEDEFKESARWHVLSPGDIRGLLNMVRRHAEGFNAIFDASGLRSRLKERMLSCAKGRGIVYLPNCESRIQFKALAAEEEEEYLWMNALALFHAGFSVWTASTFAEFDRLLPKRNGEHSLKDRPARFETIVADLELEFPDLQSAAASPPPIRDARRFDDTDGSLCLITAYGNQANRESGTEFAESHLNNATIRSKPYPGIYSLLLEVKDFEGPLEALQTRCQAIYSQQVAKISEYRKAGSDGTPAGIADDTSAPVSQHSAPFARLDVATALMARAREIMERSSCTAVDYAHAAVLAIEAKEILAGTSRTAFYHAIALQHTAEVNADASFLGTSAMLDVGGRLKSIESEIELANHDQPADANERLAAELNCKMQIFGELRSILVHREQFAAARKCLEELGKVHSKLERLPIRKLLGRRG